MLKTCFPLKIGGAIEHVSADSPDYKTFLGNYKHYKQKVMENNKSRGESRVAGGKEEKVEISVFGDMTRHLRPKSVSGTRKNGMNLREETFSIFDVVDGTVL